MKKIKITSCLLLFLSTLFFAQQEPIKIEGRAQGTTYHISYFDIQNRDFFDSIEKILQDFDQSGGDARTPPEPRVSYNRAAPPAGFVDPYLLIDR